MSFPEFGTLIEEKEEVDFPQFGTVIEEEKEEITPQIDSIKEEIGRHTARTGSRIAESLLGLPADVLKTAQLGARGVEKLAGKTREKIGLEPLPTTEKKPPPIGSEELRKFSSKLFGEKVLPQSPTESLIDNIVEDASVLAIPIKGKIPFVRSIGSAIAGNLSQEAAKSMGVGEGGQAAAKLGTFFLAGLTGKGNVKKYWKKEYELADKAIPKRARLDATKLDNRLTKLERELRKGGIETPSQKFVEKPLKEIQKIIHEGELKVDDAVAAKKKINELRSSLFTDVKGKGGQKYARTKINEVANALDEALEIYGKENPEFFKHYKAANEAYGGFFQSKKVSNWIASKVPYGRMGKNAFFLMEAIFKPSTLKFTVPAYGLFKGGELASRLIKSPTLRKYYTNLVKSAIDENKTGVLKNLKALDQTIQKEDPDIFVELDKNQ